MNRLVLLTLLLCTVVFVSACTKRSKHAVNSEHIVEADTASIDTVPGVVEDIPSTEPGVTAVTSVDSGPALSEPTVEKISPIDEVVQEPVLEEDKSLALTSNENKAPEQLTSEPSLISPDAPDVNENKNIASETESVGEKRTYKVRKGDTLMKVAFELYGDILRWKDLHNWNKGSVQNPNQLAAGTKLTYDGEALTPNLGQEGEKIKIKKGDTLGTIAHEVYGSPKSWKRLWESNKKLIKNPNKIYVGFYLYYQITEEERNGIQNFKAEKDTSKDKDFSQNVKPEAPSSKNNKPRGLSSLTSASSGVAPAKKH